MAKKQAKKKPEPKVQRVRCEECGEEHDAGQPHAAFCAGCPADAECDMCGKLGEVAGERRVARCRECNQVFCSDCGTTDERLCADCEGT